MKSQRGLTLLEVVFTVALIFFLVSSISLVYIVSLRGWANLGHRTDLDEKLHFGLERIIRDIRQANAINALSLENHTVRFTLNEGGVDHSYIYYLHNPSDTWVPAYDQASYDLRRSPLSGGLNGTFIYGNGELIITGLKPPTSTTITLSGAPRVVAITLTGQEGEDTFKVRGYVHPRNLS